MRSFAHFSCSTRVHTEHQSTVSLASIFFFHNSNTASRTSIHESAFSPSFSSPSSTVTSSFILPGAAHLMEKWAAVIATLAIIAIIAIIATATKGLHTSSIMKMPPPRMLKPLTPAHLSTCGISTIAMQSVARAASCIVRAFSARFGQLHPYQVSFYLRWGNRPFPVRILI